MYGLEWMFLIVLAVVFIVTGVTNAFRYEKARDVFPWVQDVPRTLVKVIGIAEILGVLGLILPVATGIYAWLTPLAAVGLARLMFMAATFHAQRRESTEFALTILILLMLIFVVYLRWPLMPEDYGLF